MLETGYLTLFRIRGVPVRAHWTLPLGMILFTGGRMAPGLWLGFLALIVIHELGHAFVVHRVGLANLGVRLHGMGGECRWAGSPTPIQRALVAWGGVLAQLPILVVTLILVAVLGSPSRGFLADLVYAFTFTNALLIGLNLIPLGPLDGREAWPLFGLWWAERKRRQKWKQKVAPKEPRSKKDRRDQGPQTLRQALEEADRQKRDP